MELLTAPARSRAGAVRALRIAAIALVLGAAAASDSRGDAGAVEASGGRLAPVSERVEAPPLDLEDRGGAERRVGPGPERVLLVHFWATWCAPCREELPALAALDDRLRERGLVVLAVAADARDAVERYVARERIDLTIWIDRYGGALRDYRVEALPSSFLVGRDGLVAFRAAGRVDWASGEVIGQIERLLAARPSVTP